MNERDRLAVAWNRAWHKIKTEYDWRTNNVPHSVSPIDPDECWAEVEAFRAEFIAYLDNLARTQEKQ